MKKQADTITIQLIHIALECSQVGIKQKINCTYLLFWGHPLIMWNIFGHLFPNLDRFVKQIVEKNCEKKIGGKLCKYWTPPTS